MVGDSRRDLTTHGQEHVDALYARHDDILAHRRLLNAGRLQGRHGYLRRHGRRDRVRSPDGENDEGHENYQRDRTPAPDVLAAGGSRVPPLTGQALVHVVMKPTTGAISPQATDERPA